MAGRVKGPFFPRAPERRDAVELSTEFWLQLLAYACSFAAVYGRLMVRIQYLEQKMDKHNQLVERTYKLEGQMTEVQHDIRDLKAERGT